MKIIALLPMKNERWILPTFLSSVRELADQIIVLDNNSNDNGREILEKTGATVIPYSENGEINMSHLRSTLLEAGREAGGTHFIWLDADEAFSFPFNQKGRDIITKLKPGEKLSLRWITLWKSISTYRTDEPWGLIYKDFIVCDSPEQAFSDKFLSEARTPGDLGLIKKLSESEGVVLHFQFVAWKRAELKQAYYRMRELIEGKRNARRINATYSGTLNSSSVQTEKVLSDWFKNIVLPQDFGETSANWYSIQIFQWFDKYDILFFEPLQIWQIEELRQEFIKRCNREPRSKIYPKSILALNNWKNRLKNR